MHLSKDGLNCRLHFFHKLILALILGLSLWHSVQVLHNGENDSYIRQSQLWHKIICQTQTAKFFLWNWLVILMPCNSLTNFEFEEEEFCCNLAKRHPYLRWSWERTIDSIRWCYKNQIGIKKSGPIGPVCLLSWF